MFRDAKEALKRLEAQLLAEESENTEAPEEEAGELTDEELARIRQLIRDPEPQPEIRNYANNYQSPEDTPPEEAGQQKPDNGTGRRIALAALAFLLLAGVVALVVLWLARAGGLL